MTQFYSDPERENEEHALPDCEVFQLTAAEVAATMEDEVHEFMQRREFRLAGMNSRDRERMFDAMIEELGIEGGWFYHYCQPGCLPDSDPIGPFATQEEAMKDARDNS